MAKKVAVILSEQEYAQVRIAAGAVPLSRWFRNLGLSQTIDGIKAAQKRINRDIDARSEAMPQYTDFKGTEALRNTCPHHKAKGELCYKCDGQFGNPVIE